MSSARDKLITTASDLFYRQGLPNVGINEVTDVAQVARMTLYNNFESKEDLAIAVFEDISEKRLADIGRKLGARKTTESRVRSLFDVAEESFSQPGFSGCAFVNVAMQSLDPAGRLHALANSHKSRIRSLVEEALIEVPKAKRALLAQQIVLLWDGGLVEAHLQQSVDPIVFARKAAVSLVRAQIGADREHREPA